MPCRGVKATRFGFFVSVDDDAADRIRHWGFLRRLLGVNGRSDPPEMEEAPSFTHWKGVSPATLLEGNDDCDPALLDRIMQTNFYHTIDLGNGLFTPGAFDHRPFMQYYPLPKDLTGQRVLDVATFDGYWAFEFEKRGAGEVIGLDIEKLGDADLPPAIRARMSFSNLNKRMGTGFEIAKEVLGSKVKRETLSVYDLSPERLGTFDFVFCSDLLLHLMNPMLALQRMCSVTNREAVIVDCYSPHLPHGTIRYCRGRHQCVWWAMSLEALEGMIIDAGFSKVELMSTFKTGHRWEQPSLVHAAFRATKTP